MFMLSIYMSISTSVHLSTYVCVYIHIYMKPTHLMRCVCLHVCVINKTYTSDEFRYKWFWCVQLKAFIHQQLSTYIRTWIGSSPGREPVTSLHGLGHFTWGGQAGSPERGDEAREAWNEAGMLPFALVSLSCLNRFLQGWNKIMWI